MQIRGQHRRVYEHDAHRQHYADERRHQANVCVRRDTHSSGTKDRARYPRPQEASRKERRANQVRIRGMRVKQGLNPKGNNRKAQKNTPILKRISVLASCPVCSED